ncbi:hypothetical protein ACS0TY_008449 [Phlomoides rotata]
MIKLDESGDEVYIDIGYRLTTGRPDNEPKVQQANTTDMPRLCMEIKTLKSFNMRSFNDQEYRVIKISFCHDELCFVNCEYKGLNGIKAQLQLVTLLVMQALTCNIDLMRVITSIFGLLHKR